MGFVLYKKRDKGDVCEIERAEGVRLSSPEGVIARHVAGLESSGGLALWHLTDEQLLECARLDAADVMIVFDHSSGPSQVCLYQLTRIAGESAAHSTSMVMQFKVLFDGKCSGNVDEFKKRILVNKSDLKLQLSETLVLTGGTAGGSWKWAMPDQNLGFAILSGSA